MPTDKICPECHRRFRWYGAECTDCRVTLVVATGDEPTPHVDIVSVFSTTDMALLPLAQMELERAGILYETKHLQGSRLTGGYREVVDDGAALVVRDTDAVRARELLADLEQAVPTIETQPSARQPVVRPITSPSPVDAPIVLFDQETDLPIGRLTLAQFRALDDRLEHESETDDEFYIDEATVAMLEDMGLDGEVVHMLRHGLACRGGMDVRWVEED